MRWLTVALQDLVALFVDDGRLAAATVVWLVAAPTLTHYVSPQGDWAGALLFAGLAIILAGTAILRAGK